MSLRRQCRLEPRRKRGYIKTFKILKDHYLPLQREKYKGHVLDEPERLSLKVTKPMCKQSQNYLLTILNDKVVEVSPRNSYSAQNSDFF